MIFKDAFGTYTANTDDSTRRFVTLGPNGTSSRHAAERLAARYAGRIDLYDTYEDAACAVADDPDNAALIVANAYANINHFYISHDLFPVGAFFHDTPAYVIAAKSRAVLAQRKLRVASHPAPSHLIAGVLEHPEIEILTSDSTHLAAEAAALGECDACLTTQVAAEMLGLESLAVAFPAIPMLWTVFINKGYEEWKRKPSLSCATTSRSDSKPILQL